MIVHVDWRKILERSQKDVELAVIDAVDRVFSESSDETIARDSDLGIAQSSLLVSRDPQRRAVRERDFIVSGSVRLPFSAQKTPLLEHDDVGERAFRSSRESLLLSGSSRSETSKASLFMHFRALRCSPCLVWHSPFGSTAALGRSCSALPASSLWRGLCMARSLRARFMAACTACSPRPSGTVCCRVATGAARLSGQVPASRPVSPSCRRSSLVRSAAADALPKSCPPMLA